MSAIRVSLVVALWLGVAPTAAGQVQLTIENGRVSLTATNAPLGDVLAEWERVGQTRIVNREQVSGKPITVHLENVPEERALDILLRSLNGYIAASRPTAIANTSRFDRIMIMPGTARPRTAAVSSPPAQPPVDLPRQVPVFPENDNGAEDRGRPARIVPPPGQRDSVFSAFPMPQPTPEEEAEPASPSPPQPTMPAGVPVPGMIVPAPRESNQPQSARPSPGS